MAGYAIQDGIIHSPDGIPLAPRHLADNRLSVALEERGLGDIEYYNPAAQGNPLVFRKGFWGGLRLYVERAGERYSLKLRDCRLSPYGCEGAWLAGDAEYAFALLLANDCLILSVRSTEDGSRFSLEFYDEYAFRPQAWDGNPRLKGDSRQWREWELRDGRLVGGFEEITGGTGIVIGSNAGGLSLRRSPRNTKYIVSTGELKRGECRSVVIAFDSDEARCLARLRNALEDRDNLEKRQKERYAAVAERAPRLRSGRADLDAYMQLAPMYHESLKLDAYPGAVRAKTTNYWVWGWDSLTAADAAAYWGDTGLLLNMLRFFERHDDGEGGIPHAYDRNMGVLSASPPPAQGMYLTLMHVCRNHGLDVSPFYATAKRIFETILRHEARDTGLISGTSLYPDYRELIGETGSDLSAFNNTVCYCAARSMAVIAGAIGDAGTVALADGLASRMRRRFEELFLDEARGFPASSLDADTLERRPHYGANAIKWENCFCEELMEASAERQLRFFERELVMPAGIRPFPPWDPAYDADANQLSCWWPVMGEYYARLVNRFDQAPSAERFLGWIERWTRLLSAPEGIPCYANTDEPEQDNWNTLGGTWQAYTLRGWYQAVVHNFIGLEANEGNLVVFPWSGFELELDRLHVGSASVNVAVRGAGRHVDRIVVGGQSLVGTQLIPAELLPAAGESIDVTVYRSEIRVADISLQSAWGYRVRQLQSDGHRVRLQVQGASKGRLKLRHPTGVSIVASLDGVRLDTEKLTEECTAVWLPSGDESWRAFEAEAAI